MFDLGIQELIVIFVVALLVFGPKRLPELGKGLGKSLAELKKAVQEVKEQMDSELEGVRKTGTLDAPPPLPESPTEKAEERTKDEPRTDHEKERKEDTAG